MLREVMLPALFSVLAASSAIAQNGATPLSATSAPLAKPAKEKKVCRYESPTGSNIPIATCHTKNEWAQIDAAAKPAADDLRRTMASGGH